MSGLGPAHPTLFDDAGEEQATIENAGARHAMAQRAAPRRQLVVRNPESWSLLMSIVDLITADLPRHRRAVEQSDRSGSHDRQPDRPPGGRSRTVADQIDQPAGGVESVSPDRIKAR